MLRGFSNFEQMFRHKMAKVAPTEVLVAKKMKVIIEVGSGGVTNVTHFKKSLLMYTLYIFIFLYFHRVSML